MCLHVQWCLYSVVNSSVVSEASLSSLISKRDALFDELNYYLQISPEAQEKGNPGNQLACRVSILAHVIRLLEQFLSTNIYFFKVCVILAELWCLFKKLNFVSSKLESLGYIPNINTIRSFWKLCEQQLDISGNITLWGLLL